MKALLKDFDLWGLGVFVPILAPWFERVAKLNLISNYFQPTLSQFADLTGLLAALICVALLKTKAVAKARRTAIVASIAFVVSVLLCIVLRDIVGQLWLPDEAGTVAIRAIWQAMYLCVFVSFAVAVIAGYLSIRPRRP